MRSICAVCTRTFLEDILNRPKLHTEQVQLSPTVSLLLSSPVPYLSLYLSAKEAGTFLPKVIKQQLANSANDDVAGYRHVYPTSRTPELQRFCQWDVLPWDVTNWAEQTGLAGTRI